ncbi:hypothetical protein PDIDSM_3973 [Penicillium digitatum]|nr:hypothetical protein PDIDSM_3973 [Penicillium digitatum]
MSEKRALPWLDSPPDGFFERFAHIEGRLHNVDETANIPKMTFEVVGSTGNIYKTSIGNVPTCDCPDVRFRKVQFLHAMNVAQELREMLAALSLKRILDRTTLTTTGERKPIEGECPICFHDFENKEITTWRQLCGSNLHETCFKVWEATAHASHDIVRCLYCKALWKGDEREMPHPCGEVVRAKGVRSPGRYLNVGDE